MTDERGHFNDLWARAEGSLRKRAEDHTAGDVSKLIHELHEHQIELEDKNEALVRERRKLETTRRKMTLQLQETEEQYRQLVDAVPDIVYKIDDNGCFSYLNRAVKNLGYEPEDLLGKHFSTIFHPEDAETFSRDNVLPGLQGVSTGAEKAPKLLDERRTGKRMTRHLEVRLLGPETWSMSGKETLEISGLVSSWGGNNRGRSI